MNYNFKYLNYASALYNALCKDPFYVTLERSINNSDRSKEAMLTYLDFSMSEAENYGKLYIPNDHQFGVSVWLKPLSSDLKHQKKVEKKVFLLNHLGKKALDTYLAIDEYTSTKANPFINRDSWYLSIVGILPQFQGQGLGFKLVRNVLFMTDKLSVPTYLETLTPRNKTFYNRLGYQEVESYTEPKTNATCSLMIREPKIE